MFTKVDSIKHLLIVLVISFFYQGCIEGAALTTVNITTTIITKTQESSSFEFKLYFIPIPIILLGAGISGLCCCKRCRSNKEGDDSSNDVNTMKRYNGFNGSNNKYSEPHFDNKRRPPVPQLTPDESTSNTAYETVTDGAYDSIETISGYMSIQSSEYLEPSNQYDCLQPIENNEKSKNVNKDTDGVRNASGIRSFAEVTLSKPIVTEQHNFSKTNSYDNRKEFHN